MLRRIYDIFTGWIHTRWLGGLQAGFIIRSLYIQRAFRSLDHDRHLSVLDVGCGEQALIGSVFARRYKRHTFVATDLFLGPQPVDLPNLHAVVQNIEAPCFVAGGIFDVIYALDMLEHVSDPQGVLECFAQWLRPGGLLFVHTPSGTEMNLFQGARAEEHRGFRPTRPGDDHLWDGFDMETIRGWLDGLGFQIREMRYTVNPFLLFFKELYTLGERRRLPGIGICMMPFIVLMTRLEMRFRPSKGNGLWVAARKK